MRSSGHRRVPVRKRGRPGRNWPQAVAGGGGGSPFTINPSVQSGQVYNQNEVYLTCRAGPGLGVNLSVAYQIGQQWYPSDTYSPAIYQIFEIFMDFNLAAVTGTVQSAVLSLGLISDDSTEDFTVEARTHDWGATLATADWVAGADLASKTLLATLPTSGIGAINSYKAMTESGTALKDAVIATGTGTLRMILTSDRTRLALSSATSTLETVTFAHYNDASYKPKLVITTT